MKMNHITQLFAKILLVCLVLSPAVSQSQDVTKKVKPTFYYKNYDQNGVEDALGTKLTPYFKCTADGTTVNIEFTCNRPINAIMMATGKTGLTAKDNLGNEYPILLSVDGKNFRANEVEYKTDAGSDKLLFVRILDVDPNATEFTHIVIPERKEITPNISGFEGKYILRNIHIKRDVKKKKSKK